MFPSNKSLIYSLSKHICLDLKSNWLTFIFPLITDKIPTCGYQWLEDALHMFLRVYVYLDLHRKIERFQIVFPCNTKKLLLDETVLFLVVLLEVQIRLRDCVSRLLSYQFAFLSNVQDDRWTGPHCFMDYCQ